MDGRRCRVRRDHPRRDAAGSRRLRRLPRAAGAENMDAGADADRARRGRGPDRRPRHRRRRLPAEAVCVRRTLPFAFAMALVLAALGAFVYLRVGSTLLASVDQGLRGQSQEALSRLRDDESLLDRDATESAGIAEVIAADGSVAESSPVG